MPWVGDNPQQKIVGLGQLVSLRGSQALLLLLDCDHLQRLWVNLKPLSMLAETAEGPPAGRRENPTWPRTSIAPDGYAIRDRVHQPNKAQQRVPATLA